MLVGLMPKLELPREHLRPQFVDLRRRHLNKELREQIDFTDEDEIAKR
jgi:hypothetical protein